jgi:hypothetical protein
MDQIRRSVVPIDRVRADGRAERSGARQLSDVVPLPLLLVVLCSADSRALVGHQTSGGRRWRGTAAIILETWTSLLVSCLLMQPSDEMGDIGKGPSAWTKGKCVLITETCSF